MFLSIFIAFLALLHVTQVGAMIIGQPKITCLGMAAVIELEMDKPFDGHVYLRGHYGNANCHKRFFNASIKPKVEFEFDHCEMRRKREANPRGVSFSATVIVAHHARLITYKDAAYDVKCFFVDNSRRVDIDLKVSSEAPAVMEAVPELPSCSYEVISSNDNQTTKFARVGDSVMHRWQCGGPNARPGMFCMRVHSCVASDGTEKHPVVDSSGCTTDTELILPIHYPSDLSATALSRVFKFPETGDVTFMCQLQLSLKSEFNQTCPPPDCKHRLKRSLSYAFNKDVAERQRIRDSFDVESQRIAILERTKNEQQLGLSTDTALQVPKMCAIATPALLGLSLAFMLYFVFTMCIFFQKTRIHVDY